MWKFADIRTTEVVSNDHFLTKHIIQVFAGSKATSLKSTTESLSNLFPLQWSGDGQGKSTGERERRKGNENLLMRLKLARSSQPPTIQARPALSPTLKLVKLEKKVPTQLRTYVTTRCYNYLREGSKKFEEEEEDSKVKWIYLSSTMTCYTFIFLCCMHILLNAHICIYSLGIILSHEDHFLEHSKPQSVRDLKTACSGLDQLGNTSSRMITEVKQCWARRVLGWETVQVLPECCC